MRFFCHISFLQFSGELYSHLVLYFITIGFADYIYYKWEDVKKFIDKRKAE